MKDKFEASLLESGEVFKRGAAALISNAGRAIALLTLAVTALVLLTDISFTELGTERFCSTLAIMLTSSYVMYFSATDAGERLGEESEEYKGALKLCTSLSARVGGDKIPDLRRFCQSYAAEELKYRREALLMRHGYSPDEYASWKRGERAVGRARRSFLRADRLRSAVLSPKILLTLERGGRKSELASPERARLPVMLLKMLPTALCMTVTVSVMLTSKEGINAAAVTDVIFKLASLLLISFKGYSSGYVYVKRSLTAWLETKSRLLSAFLAEDGERTAKNGAYVPAKSVQTESF